VNARYTNAATGEWIEFTAVAEDNDGQLVRFSWRSVPGGVITEHVHPRQEERFIITSGEARFTLDGEELTARAGETIVVPAGARHSEGNPGPAEIQAVVELRPALRSKEFHEAVAGLAADGKTTPRGAPRNPLQLGATFWHFRHESRVTSPPIGMQNLMLPPLWAVARASAYALTTPAGTAGSRKQADHRRQCLSTARMKPGGASSDRGRFQRMPRGSDKPSDNAPGIG
jgi:quercetin dioxygenase-like cupin family protein